MSDHWTILIFCAWITLRTSASSIANDESSATTEMIGSNIVLEYGPTIDENMNSMTDITSIRDNTMTTGTDTTSTLVTDSVDMLCSECNHNADDLTISGLKVQTQNNTVLIDWTQFDETKDYCIFNYKLSVDELDFTRYGSYANISKVFPGKYCGKYVVHLDAMNKCVDTSTTINVTIVPGKIKHLKMDLNRNFLTWDPPEDGSCVNGYQISGNSNISLLDANERQVDLRFWPTCQEYSVSIAAMSDLGPGPSYGPTKIVHNPLEVKFTASIEQVNRSIIVNVTPAETLSQCNLEYEVILNDSYQNRVLTTLPFIFRDTIPCEEYNISISMIANRLPSEKQFYTVLTNEAPPDDLEIEIIEINLNNATINVTVQPSEDFKCRPNITIECDPPVSIIDEDDFIKILTDLKPFTIYSCISAAMGTTVNFTLETLQDVPGSVQNIEVSNVTEEGFLLKWQKPEDLPGILTAYEVIINGTPNYETAFNDCALFTYFNSIQTLETYLLLHNLFSNYKYSVNIRAKTIDFGPDEQFYVYTKVQRPSVVHQFYYNISKLSENKLMAHFNWKMPCNIYSNVDNIQFEIVLIETCYENIENRTIERSHNIQELDVSIQPSSNYTVRITIINIANGLQSLPIEIQFEAPRGNTTAPIWIDSESNQSRSYEEFTITWLKPTEIYGKLTNYLINITREESLHFCVIENSQHTEIFNISATNHFKFETAKPNQRYRIEITAITTEGVGRTLTKSDFISKGPKGPSVNNLAYIFLPRNDDVYLKSIYFRIEPSCQLTEHYEYNVKLINEQGFVVIAENRTENEHQFDLQPNTFYKIVVCIVSHEFASFEKAITFLSPVGLPPKPILHSEQVVTVQSPTTIDVHLRNDYFNTDNGRIVYYSILIGLKSLWVSEADNGFWNESNWNFKHVWNEQGAKYQATPEFWTPFKGNLSGNASLTFSLGVENCSALQAKYCNGALRPDSEYILIIRGLTEQTYRDSNLISFRTLEDFSKAKTALIIVGVLVSLLIIGMLVAFMLLRWKRKRDKGKQLDDNKQKPITLKEDGLLSPESVSINCFNNYYSNCSADMTLLINEYLSLSRVGEDCDITIASKQENRKKNRYVNILPYDYTRVKLDYGSYDYINASYIRGYSGAVEYIATQGPLESTTADFWNMVLKEECNVVAMVAQFQEQNKIKCHKYFPENREQIELIDEDGNEITIRCSYEMNFDYYTERQIIVQTDEKVFSITHLQFLHWPDFGCPDGTINMLQFTLILRRHMEENNSKAVIHCSAGVGRTGTLIAVDILLQTIRDQGDINVYEIVAELRRQRPKMVQAEQQYLYIYKCVNDAILQPLQLAEIKAIDPIYENMENLIEMKDMKIVNNNCEVRSLKTSNEQITTENDDAASEATAKCEKVRENTDEPQNICKNHSESSEMQLVD